MLVKTMSRKFQVLCAKVFGDSAQGLFFKIPWWHHKHLRAYKRGILIFYFSSNVAKKSSYGPNTSKSVQWSISFILKQILLYFTHSKKVKSVLLNWDIWLTSWDWYSTIWILYSAYLLFAFNRTVSSAILILDPRIPERTKHLVRKLQDRNIFHQKGFC